MDGDEGSGGAGRAVVTGSWHGGAQLYVSLKMEKARIIGDLVPHVYGSEPIIGSWDPAHAVRTRRPPLTAATLLLPRLPVLVYIATDE
jgi:6-phosphofructo-2-kinase/fructose-2,6-biphosphatase